MRSSRLSGASIAVRARLEPDDTDVPAEGHGSAPFHVVGFVPELDEAYEVRTVMATLQQRVRFAVDGRQDLEWETDAKVPLAGSLFEEVETQTVEVVVVACGDAQPGSSDLVQSRLQVLRRQDKFTGKWIDITADAEAFRCSVDVPCRIAR